MKKLSTTLFLTVLMLLGATNVMAQFENGKVYRIVCSGTNSVSLGATALTDVEAVSTNETAKAQQWYVTVNDGNYTFRNLANGRYLLGKNDTSAEWGLTKESNNFTVTSVNSNYCIRGASHTNGYGYMHKDGGNNIVSWTSSAENSQWTPIEVAYTTKELQAVWAAIDALVVSDETVSRYNELLGAMFKDKACTQLNSVYAGKDVDQIKADANYQALPAVLQSMVLKVKNGDWSEANVVGAKEGWSHDYAKRFRVQMYEPYSIEGEITSYLRINAHCNMDNPTGIYANAGEPIFIMVDGDIAEGAELWVAHQTGLGATNYYDNKAYFQLKEGLNIVPYFNDASTLWINYVVHTYNEDGATVAEKFPHKISDYKPLKIHVEGGHINGYYNAIGDFRAADSGTENLWGDVDNDDDWNYYKERAPLNGTDAPNRDFPLLGHRQTLLFPLGPALDADGHTNQGLLYHLDEILVQSTPNCYSGSSNGFGDYSENYYPGMGLSKENGKINIMLEAWDRIMYSELASMGVVSKSTMDKMNALYPRWTSNGTPAEIYNYGSATINDVTQTYQDFCQGIDYSEYFNHHGCGVGAPSGYMSGGWRVCNYHYNTMGSIIGRIANEAGPTWGPAHEIGHQHQAVFNMKGQTEVTNNFFSNVAVWYMGMGTSRVNGNEGSLESVLAAFNEENNNLYTNNIWAITHMYYRLWLYYHLAGNNTQFWPRLFELCRQIPIIGSGNVSGEVSLLRFYKHACDAAGEDLTEFFRAHGFFETIKDLTIDDYGVATYNVTQEEIDAAIAYVKNKKYPANYAVLLINDGTSETTKKHDGSTLRDLWDNNATAEFGSVNDFIDGDIDVLTNYTASVSADGTVTMSDGDGGVGFLVFNNEGELVSFSNKSTFALSADAKYQLATGKASVVTINAENETVPAEIDLTAMQKGLLESFVADVEAMPIDDGSYRRVGCYTKASAAELLTALENAKAILEAGKGGYVAAYELLKAAQTKLIENTDKATFVPFDPSLTYIITNYAYGNIMHLNSGLKSSASADKSANTSKWQFKATSTDGVYNVYCSSGYYLPAISKSNGLSVVSDQSSAAAYALEATDNVGAWTISTSQTTTDGYGALHDKKDGYVVGWNTVADASKWYLTAVEGSENSMKDEATDELQALIAKTENLIDVIGVAVPCNLQTTDANAPFYLWCNANVTSGGDTSLPANGYNILDGNDRTFLHTVFSGNSQDGLHHYLRLDMGEGNSLSKVQFSYKTRHEGNSNSHPKVIKVEGSNDLSVFEEIATISEGLPEGYSAVYTSAELTNGKSYRYIRFMVTDTYGTATDGNGHEYFYIAEFSIPSLGDVYAKIDAEYQEGVTEETFKGAYNAVAAAKTATDDKETAKSTLQTAYNALKAQYDIAKGVDGKKAELQALIDETNELIALAGTVELAVEEKLTLTEGNFYCNAAHTSDGGATKDNQYNLADDNYSTYLHTNPNNTSGDGLKHYLRVDVGDGNSTKKFKFNYQNRTPSSYKVFPKVLKIEGSKNGDSYEDIVTISSGLPDNAGGAYESAVLGNGKEYRYIRFMVESTYAGRGTPNYFCMAEFSFYTKDDKITIKDGYDRVVSEEQLLSAYLAKEASITICNTENVIVSVLDTQIAELQAAKDALYAAMNATDKAELQSLYELAEPLYAKMADGEGNVNDSYKPSALTNEKLAEVKDALDAAKDKLDNSNSQVEIDAAKDALQTAYDALLAIENANVATTIDKSSMNTAISDARDLIAEIKANLGYYESVAGLGLVDLGIALQNAQAVVDRFYLTEAQYNDALATLNTCLSATQAVVNADCADRTALTTLIDDVNILLYTIADEGGTKMALPLQSTNADEAYYIWCNAPAGDSNGVAGLIDKNADGTANTGTFLGTNWGTAVPAYTHYIEIDLGDGTTIDKLSMDYTTRNSTHANQRPDAIKILGSNDKDAYTPITEITEGLAVNANEKWSMDEPLDLGADYRYIRIAVGSEQGFFHMSDFNLYVYTPDAVVVKDYYSTMPLEDGQLNEIYDALMAAKYAEDKYLTQNEYESILAGLQALFNELKTLKNLDYDGNRTALEGLITDEKIDAVMSLDTKETTLPLQCADITAPYYLFCNAPGTTNSYRGDNLGVAAALDMVNGAPDRTTFLHTTYTGNGYSDELDHYLRLDMGAEQALVSFKFSYKPRNGNIDNAPKAILVEGCNDLENGEFEEIVTLTNLPTEYNSGEITNGKAYRYVRFMVKETHNNSKYNGHPFFALDHFAVSSCKAAVVKEYYAGALGVGLVADAYNTKPLVQDIVNRYVTEADYNSALEKVQAVADALQAFLDEDYDGDRNAYDEMLANTAQLVADAYEGTALPLQCNDAEAPYYLFCNAPGTTNNWDGDNSGVAAVIDLNDNGEPNLDTFLHTTYYGDGCSDNLDHYLRVDMGEGKSITAFKFSYVPRSGYERNSPTKIVIEGCNDLASGVFEEITTLIGLTGAAYQSGVITNDNAYRYIRFVVEETKDGDNYSYKGHPYFSMSHFAVSSCDIKEYYTTSPVEYIHDACVEMTKAQKVKGHYITESEYETAYNNLQTAYNNLQGLMDADVTERTAFGQLVADTEALIAEIVTTIDLEEALLPLQCTDESAPYYLFCNAPGTTNSYYGDNLGVAALLDVDDNGEPITVTFLHTTYTGNDHTDALDHYLCVDMGESSLLSFKFGYIPRVGNTGNAPLVMLIEGSNDCVNFEEITTLTDLPTTYRSGEITNGKVYRYIRFMVKDTHDHSAYDGHKFFAMSYFEMAACKKVALKENYNYNINFTPELIIAAYVEKQQANVVNTHYATEEDYTTAFNELQVAYNALNNTPQVADLPVKLTWDVNKPVLYRIKINRTATTVLEFDNATKQVAVAAKADIGNEYQAWYFMQGTDAESNDDILIMPYWNEGAKNTTLRLGAASTGNASAAVWAVESDDATKIKQNWYITFDDGKTANGWWNIRPEGKDNYFSNNGGVANKMGFWNSSSDDGSEFQFILDDTDYSLSDAYFALYNLHQTCGGEKPEGEKIGMYKETTDYNAAYKAATPLIEDKSATDDTYTSAKDNLLSLFNALERNMPVEGGLYRLRSANTKAYSKDKLVYVNSENKPHFDSPSDETLSNYIWQFETNGDGFSIKNLHTQSYINSASWSTQVVLGEPKKVTIEVLDDATGELKLNVSGGYPLHAQNTNSALVGYKGDAGSASAWYIEEVNAEDVYYPYTLTSVGYGTLMLGFDAIVPDGVTAYYATSVNEDGTSVHMEPVDGVVPANTAVILKSDDKLEETLSLSFMYSCETECDPVDGNMLAGTLYKKVVKCEDNTKVYVMQAKDDVAQMYWAYENYNADGKHLQVDAEGNVIVDDKGNIVETKVEGGSYNHDKGGHIMNSANRAYLVVPQMSLQPTMFNLRFGGVITELDELEEQGAENNVIYDLQGRKLDGIARSGFYIVNGKKMLVK